MNFHKSNVLINNRALSYKYNNLHNNIVNGQNTALTSASMQHRDQNQQAIQDG